MNDAFKKIFDNLDKDLEIRKRLGIDSKILIIDGLNNYIRTWVVKPTTDDNGTHIGGITGFLQTIGVSIRKFDPTRLIIVFDGKGGSQRRRKKYPEYKIKRGHGVKLNRVHNWTDEKDEAKQMLYQLSRSIQYLKHLPVTIISIDNIEADDTIGYLCKELCIDEQQEIIIQSTDKDFFQLIRNNVKVYNPVSHVLIDNDYLMEKYKIHSNNFLLFKAMIEDKGDNIPGIKGIGVKTINKQFPILSEEKSYNLNEFIDYVKERENNSRAHKLLIDNEEKYRLYYDLITLAENNMSGQDKLKIISYYRKIPKKMDKFKIIKMSMNDKLYGVFPNIANWLDENFSYLNSFAK